jgi:hypothetical protein
VQGQGQARQALKGCRHCSFYGGYAADCKTQLRTRQQRIHRARCIFAAFDNWRAREILAGDGVSEDEMREGLQLAQEDQRQRRLEIALYGRPEYGFRPGIDKDMT